MAGVSNTDWSWTALFADLDLDGNKDLVVTNGLFRDVRNKDYINEIKDLVTKHNKSAESLSNTEINQNVYELAIAAPSHRLENSAFKNNGDLTFKDIASTWNLDFSGWTQGGAQSVHEAQQSLRQTFFLRCHGCAGGISKQGPWHWSWYPNARHPYTSPIFPAQECRWAHACKASYATWWSYAQE